MLQAAESPSGRPEIGVATRNVRAAARGLRKLDRHRAQLDAVLACDDLLVDHVCNNRVQLSESRLKRLVRVGKNGTRQRLNRDTRTDVQRPQIAVCLRVWLTFAATPPMPVSGPRGGV